MKFKKPYADIYKLEDIDIITQSFGTGSDENYNEFEIGGGSDGEFF